MSELDRKLPDIRTVKPIYKGEPGYTGPIRGNTFGPYTLVETTKKRRGYNGIDDLPTHVSKSMADFIFTDKSSNLVEEISDIIRQIKKEHDMRVVRKLITKRDKLIAKLHNHRLREQGEEIQQYVLDDVIKMKAIPEKYNFLLYNNEEDFFVKNVYDEIKTITDKQVRIFGQVKHDLGKQEEFIRIWKKAKKMQKKGGKNRTRKNKKTRKTKKKTLRKKRKTNKIKSKKYINTNVY